MEAKTRNSLFAPNCLGLWPSIALMWITARLPRALQIPLGRLIGLAFHAIGRRRRRIAEINLRLAFPNLDERQRRDLVRRTFISTGHGVVETATAWFGTDERIRKQVTIRGLEHLENALKQGRGVIMLGSHTTSIEICGRRLGQIHPFADTYKPHRNPCFETLMGERRRRIYGEALPITNLRAIIGYLKAGGVIWYASDQNLRKKNSVEAEFFGVPAATTTGASRLARMAGAVCIPCFAYRSEDARTAILEFLPALDDFPTEDPAADTQRLMRMIEEHLRKRPEQYLWVHRRYKTADPERDPYRG